MYEQINSDINWLFSDLYILSTIMASLQTKLLSLRVPVINRNPIQIIRQVFMNNLRVASSIWLNGSSGKKI